VRALAAEPGGARQVELARRSPERLPGLVRELAARFSSPASVTGARAGRFAPKGAPAPA
jgi:hypothetical protein